MAGMTPTEQIVAEIWPNELMRKNYGCDFKDAKSGELVEIKSGVLTPNQINEMNAELAAGRHSLLVIIEACDYYRELMIFRLERVQPLIEGYHQQVTAFAEQQQEFRKQFALREKDLLQREKTLEEREMTVDDKIVQFKAQLKEIEDRKRGAMQHYEQLERTVGRNVAASLKNAEETGETEKS